MTTITTALKEDAILSVSMNPAAEELMEAVEAQRGKLLNVLSLTQALKIAGAAADEGAVIDNLEGALEILQEAIAGIVEGLEEIELNRAIAAAREAS